jgi:hypothetical protein
MAILRFQGGSSHLCQLRTASFWPWWTSFDLYWPHVGFMEPDKSSSPVTTLSNHTSPLWGGLLEGEWGSLGWWPGQMIAGGQDFIPGGGAQIRFSRDIMDGCRMWDLGDYTYDVSVRFFPYRVYTDPNCHNTLGYKWPLVVAVIL